MAQPRRNRPRLGCVRGAKPTERDVCPSSPLSAVRHARGRGMYGPAGPKSHPRAKAPCSWLLGGRSVPWEGITEDESGGENEPCREHPMNTSVPPCLLPP